MGGYGNIQYVTQVFIFAIICCNVRVISMKAQSEKRIEKRVHIGHKGSMKKNTIILTAVFTALCLLFLGKTLVSVPGKISAPNAVVTKQFSSGYFCEIPVILYHNVDGVGPFSVTSKQLDEHFKFYRDNNVSIISLSDLNELLEGNIDPTKKYAIISFDDGYPAMKSRLLPIAKKYGYPISLFIYTDYVGQKNGKLLSWDDLRMLDKEGLQIESHSISHADMLKTQATNNRRLVFRELYLSKRIIELMLDRTIDHFAFPYGSYDRNTLQYAEAAGYERLHTTEFGANISENNNVLIKRHHIKNSYTTARLRRILDMQ